jgi:D-alanine-D-alanine ligase
VPAPSTAPDATDRRRTILHLVGSPTSAFHADLSRLYAADCLEQLAGEDGDVVHVAYVTPDGLWRFPVPPAAGPVAPGAGAPGSGAADALGAAALAAAEPVPVAVAVAHVAALGVDLMVPQMFCVAGMTAYRALFDVLGIPYVGNTPAVMALTANKAQARAVVAAAGIDVPAGELVRAGGSPTIAPPAVVKPVDADNSVGVALVRDAAEYDAAIATALEHSRAALVEAYVPLGREVRCGVVERDGELVCLPLEEYRVGDVRTAADKIVRHEDGDLRLMAKDVETAWIVDADDPIVAPVHHMARRAYVALGCRHYGLFDVRVDPDGRPWFLEASLYCSFARQSVLCVMAQATGVGPRELFRQIQEETHGR